MTLKEFADDLKDDELTVFVGRNGRPGEELHIEDVPQAALSLDGSIIQNDRWLWNGVGNSGMGDDVYTIRTNN